MEVIRETFSLLPHPQGGIDWGWLIWQRWLLPQGKKRVVRESTEILAAPDMAGETPFSPPAHNGLKWELCGWKEGGYRERNSKNFKWTWRHCAQEKVYPWTSGNTIFWDFSTRAWTSPTNQVLDPHLSSLCYYLLVHVLQCCHKRKLW